MYYVVTWLQSLEKRASDLYREASLFFEQDTEFSQFLRELSEEEAWHERLIQGGIPSGENHDLGDALIAVDEDTRGHIESMFARAELELRQGIITKDGMLEVIAAIEFSEWNDLFLYAMGALKKKGDDYSSAVAEIEQHKEAIAVYLSELPQGRRYVNSMSQLPAVGEKKLLVIEADEVTARLLEGILAPIGEIEWVRSEKEGLLRLEKRTFDAILSDADMVGMDTMEFYRQAVAVNPEAKGHFLFFAGDICKEVEGLFASQEATFIGRPTLISELRKAVSGIANSQRTVH